MQKGASFLQVTVDFRQKKAGTPGTGLFNVCDLV